MNSFERFGKNNLENNLDYVVVRLFGGLGNQIFQYMAGMWLAEYQKSKLIIDKNWLQDGYKHKNSTIAEFKFYNPDFEFGEGHKNSIHLNYDRMLTIAARNSASISRLLKINAPKTFGYENLMTLARGVQLRGYYQSPRYFMEMRTKGVIQEEFLELLQPSVEYQRLQRVSTTGGFLAVHIRGGDYLEKGSLYIRLSSYYYKEGLRILDQSHRNLPIWVFTDDLPYARHLLNEIPNLFFVHNETLSAAESMKLMSNAKGIVCANSTFSYWACVMSGLGSTVVAPKNWLINIDQPAAFFLENWTII